MVTQNKMSKVRCAPGEVLVAFVSEFHEKPWASYNNYLKRLKMKLVRYSFFRIEVEFDFNFNDHYNYSYLYAYFFFDSIHTLINVS